jgi:molybdopterin-guanine dinucleotide biosynthesis protein A
MISNELHGLILAGGKSSRMGQDKAMIEFHGKPQHIYLTDELKPVCKEVFISCRKSQYPSLRNIIVDHFELKSPLNGILSAFHFDPFASWLTVPADMPNINREAVAFLVNNRNRQKLATCFTDSEGVEPEPLFTLWEQKARPAIFDFFNSGGFSAKKFLQENDVNILPCPNPQWLININDPDELMQYLSTKKNS